MTTSLVPIANDVRVEGSTESILVTTDVRRSARTDLRAQIARMERELAEAVIAGAPIAPLDRRAVDRARAAVGVDAQPAVLRAHHAAQRAVALVQEHLDAPLVERPQHVVQARRGALAATESLLQARQRVAHALLAPAGEHPGRRAAYLVRGRRGDVAVDLPGDAV